MAGRKEHLGCPQESRIGSKETRDVHRKEGLALRLWMSVGDLKGGYGCLQET
jgi:hypothetical protein